MGFSLHPCVTQDAEDITRIFQAAFADDHIIGHFHPHTPKDVYFASDVKFFKLQIEEQGMWGGKVTKVVDDETGYFIFFFHLISVNSQGSCLNRLL